MDAPQLTANACSALWNGNTDFHPVLQCIEARALQAASGNTNGTERFRVSLSDGQHFIHAMLATQLVDFVKNGSIQPGTIIRLQEFLCNEVHGRKITIILNLDVLGNQPIKGNPTNIQSKGGAPPQAQPQAPAQAPAGQNQYQLGYGGSNAPQSYGKPQQTYGAQQQQGGGSYGYAAQQANVGYAPKPLMEHNPPPSMQGQGQGPGGMYHSNQAHQRGPPPSMSYQANQNYGAPGQSYGMSNNYQQQQKPKQPNPLVQVPNNYVPKGAISRNEAPVRIVPIKSLNPYLNRWTIQARVTSKSDVRRWHNAKGEGTVFNFDVLDGDGGEIRICAFKEACEKFNPLIEVGKVYTISKGALRPARKQYNHLNNDFEIYLETNSTIEPCVEDGRTSSIPSITFNFKPILDLEQVATGTIVDVIGVVTTVSDAATIQRRDGTETQKRNLTIKDDSNAQIELTLWGGYCMDPGQQLETDLQQGLHPIVAIKSTRVGEYNGKTLGSISSTQVRVNPDIPEAGRLRHWYDHAGGAHQQALQLNTGGGGKSDRRIVLSDIRDEALGTQGKPDYVECISTISFIRNETLYYPACTLQRNGRMCKKKLTLTDDGAGWCETCQQKSTPEYTWMLQVTANDSTGSRWITCFGEIGNDIMGMTANDLKLYENTPQFDFALQRALFKTYLFKLKVAEDTYNDEKRVKVNIVKMNQINHEKESHGLVAEINKLLGGQGEAEDVNRNVKPRMY